MEKSEIRILGIMISKRVTDATTLQAVLTRYGCSIKTRLGLHPLEGNVCSPSGLVILELAGDTGEMDRLEKELQNMQGFVVQKMVFNIE